MARSPSSLGSAQGSRYYATQPHLAIGTVRELVPVQQRSPAQREILDMFVEVRGAVAENPQCLSALYELVSDLVPLAEPLRLVFLVQVAVTDAGEAKCVSATKPKEKRRYHC